MSADLIGLVKPALGATPWKTEVDANWDRIGLAIGAGSMQDSSVNPNGNIAGLFLGQRYIQIELDGTDLEWVVEWMCVKTGDAAGAVWTRSGGFEAGDATLRDSLTHLKSGDRFYNIAARRFEYYVTDAWVGIFDQLNHFISSFKEGNQLIGTAWEEVSIDSGDVPASDALGGTIHIPAGGVNRLQISAFANMENSNTPNLFETMRAKVVITSTAGVLEIPLGVIAKGQDGGSNTNVAGGTFNIVDADLAPDDDYVISMMAQRTGAGEGHVRGTAPSASVSGAFLTYIEAIVLPI